MAIFNNMILFSTTLRPFGFTTISGLFDKTETTGGIKINDLVFSQRLYFYCLMFKKIGSIISQSKKQHKQEKPLDCGSGSWLLTFSKPLLKLYARYDATYNRVLEWIAISSLHSAHEVAYIWYFNKLWAEFKWWAHNQFSTSTSHVIETKTITETTL